MTNGGAVRARNDEPLTNDMLMAAVPSIFATEAHESRSARFAPVPTCMVLDGLRKEGFEPFYAQQSRTRVEGKAEFTKHMLRLRHRGITNKDGEAFEVILTNANDGTAAYQMLPGFFRFVCANGLFVGESFEEVKVRHSGNAVDAVIEGTYRVLDEAPRALDTVAQWKGIRLLPAEQEIMAEAAHALRFPEAYAEGDDRKEVPVGPSALLRPRRYTDNAPDLWATFNRVQENTIKGGQRGLVHGANGRARNASTRAVQGIDQSKGLNRALWMLTERMAELKAVA
jgi:hypothetical protein